MQIATILSDLNSLRVCVRFSPLISPQPPQLIENLQDHSAALALVTAKPSPSSFSSSSSSSEKEEEKDNDLRRATDLLELHYGVKMKYVRASSGAGGAGGGGRRRGEDEMGLMQARKDVEGVLARLGNGREGAGGVGGEKKVVGGRMRE